MEEGREDGEGKGGSRKGEEKWNKGRGGDRRDGGGREGRQEDRAAGGGKQGIVETKEVKRDGEDKGGAEEGL